MPHTEYANLPSVTQIINATHEKKFLMEAAGKLGTKKAEILGSTMLQAYTKEELVKRIPDAWFIKNRINRPDFWKNHVQLWGEKADIGTQFHNVVESGLRYGWNQIEAIDPVINPMVKTFERWAQDNKVDVIALERQVISKAYGYHGTYDAKIMLGNKGPIIADWKTSSSINVSEYMMQLAAYAQAELEDFGKYVEGGLIVRVDKATAKLEMQEFSAEQLKEAFLVFLSAKDVYTWHKKHEKKWGFR